MADDSFDEQSRRLLGDVFSTPPPPDEKPGRKLTTRRSAILMGVSAGVIGFFIGAAAAGSPTQAPLPGPVAAHTQDAVGGARETIKPSPTGSQKPTQAPEAPFGDGDHLVGADVKPGTYRSTGASEGLVDLCMVSVLDGDGNVLDMKSGNGDSDVIIKVSASGDVVSVTGCEPFKRVR